MTQDLLFYVLGALLVAIVVPAALYWRYPWSRQRGRFGIAGLKIERDEPANRVVLIAAIAGALAILVDRFI